MIKFRNLELDLGCGAHKQPGFLGLDMLENSQANVICDMEQGLPFEDNTVKTIFTAHFLEHVTKPEFLLQEIYRVCQHEAHVTIIIPLNCRPFGFPDPAHKVEFDFDWLKKYIDLNKFSIYNYRIDRIKTSASREPYIGKEFEYDQATLQCRIMKVTK